MELATVDAVLFDLDGVLTPTADLHMKAWDYMFSEYFRNKGCRSYTDSDYFEHLDGKPRLEGIRALLLDRGIEIPNGNADDDASTESVIGLGARKNSQFLELLRQGIEPYPGSVKFLDALLKAGVQVAVVSSSANATEVLAASGLASRFRIVVDGQVARAERLPGKPEPDTYTYAAQQLGVPTKKCVVVEDAVSGVQAGAAGSFALVVGVDRGAGHSALFAAGADLVVDDLEDLMEQLPQTGEHARPPASS